MRRLLYLLLVVILLPLLLPVLTLGGLWFQWPIWRQRGRVSGTAYEPFTARLCYHLLGSRPDPLSWQLAAGLPATRSWWFRQLALPLLTGPSRLAAYTPSFLHYPPERPLTLTDLLAARTEFHDRALAAAGGLRQFVVLGAGWDTRGFAWRSDPQRKVFEVDMPATQAVKRAALDKARIDAARVTFVACDFQRQSWLEALAAAGLDLHQPTFFLWEGVSMYLEEPAVQETLRAVARLPAGSAISFDFFSHQWLNDSWTGKRVRTAVHLVYGELFRFGFPVRPQVTRALELYLQESGLQACGLVLREAVSWGDQRPGSVPFGGAAVCVADQVRATGQETRRDGSGSQPIPASSPGYTQPSASGSSGPRRVASGRTSSGTRDS